MRTRDRGVRPQSGGYEQRETDCPGPRGSRRSPRGCVAARRRQAHRNRPSDPAGSQPAVPGRNPRSRRNPQIGAPGPAAAVVRRPAAVLIGAPVGAPRAAGAVGARLWGTTGPARVAGIVGGGVGRSAHGTVGPEDGGFLLYGRQHLRFVGG